MLKRLSLILFVLFAFASAALAQSGIVTGEVKFQASTAYPQSTKTANYTLTASDYTIFADTSAGGFTTSLPTAASSTGRIYCIRKTSGSNTLVIDVTGGGTIDGALSISFTTSSAYFFTSNGTEWKTLATFNIGGGGGGSPGGTTNSLQINNGASAFDGGANALLDLLTSTITLGTNSSQSGKVALRNSGNANATTIQPSVSPASAVTITLPNATATLMTLGLAETVTGTKTFGTGLLQATSPRFTTDISDVNGNEVFKITATASAVNEFTVVNSATGNAVDLQASGGDTNVSIKLTPKGTGTLSSAAQFFDLSGSSTASAVRIATGNAAGASVHPGTGGGITFPFVGGSQSSGPGIWWTNNAYNATSGLWLSNGLNFQGATSTHSPFIIRSSTSSSSNGSAIFTFTPDSGAWTAAAGISNTATAADVETFNYNSTGTAAANFGVARLYQLENSTGSQVNAVRLISSWATATAGAETGQFIVSTNLAGAGVGQAFAIEGSQFYGTAFTGNITGAATIDFRNGNVQELTLTGNVTSTTLSNLRSGGQYTLIFKQGGTGSNTLTATNISVKGGSATLGLSTAVGARDIFTCSSADGTTLYCINSNMIGSGGGSGTVTNTNTLTGNSFIFGDGTTAIKSTGAAATNGQVLIGSTSANPVAATLSFGDDINVNNDAGSITVNRVTNNATNVALMLPTMGGVPVVTDSASALVTAANDIRVLLIQVTQKSTYNNFAYTIVSNAVGNASVGIYSLDGSTRVCYSGTFSTNSSGAANAALSAACTLSPGLYLYAWTADTNTPTFRSAAAFTNFFQTANQGSKYLGKTSTTSTSGALPTSISTTITTDNTYPIPFVKLYN